MITFAKSSSSAAAWLVLLLFLVSATSLGQVTLSLPNTAASPGSTFSIPVNIAIPAGQNVGSFEFEVLCDTSIMKFTGIDDAGTKTSGNPPTANWYAGAYNAGRIKLTWASLTSITGNGVLIYLKATAQSTIGNTSLQLSKAFVWDANTSPVQVSTTNGSVRSNHPPTAGAISSKTVAEKDTLRFTATASDPDLPNDALSFSLSGAPAGATISAAGAFLWVPNFGQAGSYSFRVKVTDLGLATDSTSVSVTVTHKNQAPSFVSELRDTTINQGSTLTFSYGASDPDVGTTLLYSLVGGPSGASINSSGVLTFTPPTNPARTYSIVAVASDGFLADTAKATVTVNRKPSILSKSPASLTLVSQNKSQLFSVSAVNIDGGALTFQWKVNGVVDKSGPDSTYTKSFADANGTTKSVVCVALNSVGLKDSVTWSFTITDVEKKDGSLPTEFSLGQNYPNPFNPSTTIMFDLPKEAPVTLEVYNVLGVRVRSLLSGQALNAGTHSMVWDGRDDNGITLPSGVYLYRINAADFQASRKMTMVK